MIKYLDNVDARCNIVISSVSNFVRVYGPKKKRNISCVTKLGILMRDLDSNINDLVHKEKRNVQERRERREL